MFDHLSRETLEALAHEATDWALANGLVVRVEVQKEGGGGETAAD